MSVFSTFKKEGVFGFQVLNHFLASFVVVRFGSVPNSSDMNQPMQVDPFRWVRTYHMRALITSNLKTQSLLMFCLLLWTIL